MTRGIRNNNPLNIRHSPLNHWKGLVLIKKDDKFEEFVSMYYGFRAALITIRNYVIRHGCNTVEKIITRWAPPTENNTANYIAYVCNATGLGGKENISVNDARIKTIVAAMAVMESGKGIVDYFMELDQAWSDLPTVSMKTHYKIIKLARQS